jgi:hypothetical protein
MRGQLALAFMPRKKRWRQPYSAARGYPPFLYREIPAPLVVIRWPNSPKSLES